MCSGSESSRAERLICAEFRSGIRQPVGGSYSAFWRVTVVAGGCSFPGNRDLVRLASRVIFPVSRVGSRVVDAPAHLVFHPTAAARDRTLLSAAAGHATFFGSAGSILCPVAMHVSFRIAACGPA